MSDIAEVSPTEAAAPAATPAMAPAGSPASTAETQGSQASTGQSAPSEETFFSGDPNTLPPELREQYNNMLKDYKQKTQSIAETRKKAEAFDKINQDQRFKEYWSGLDRTQKAQFKEQKQEAEKRLGEKISDDEFAKGFQSKDDFLELVAKVMEVKGEKSQKKIAELEQYKTVTEASNIVEAFATEQGPDGKPVRPDFYSLDDDQLISGFLNVNPPSDSTQASYVAKLNEAYGWAKAVTQKYYEKGKAEAQQIVQKKVANSSLPPTNAAKGAYNGPDPKKITPAEALQMAKRGERIPQNYD